MMMMMVVVVVVMMMMMMMRIIVLRPSLKFVGLPVPKIWLIFGHGR